MVAVVRVYLFNCSGQTPLALDYIIAYFFFFFLPPQGMMTSFNIILIPLYYIKNRRFSPSCKILGGEVIGGLLQPVKLYFLIIPQKPPYPLPLPLSGAMGFIGGLLLIMPVMTAPANHTHYSAWTGTLIIAWFCAQVRRGKTACLSNANSCEAPAFCN